MKNISNTELAKSVINVGFDRSILKTKIIHLGFGAFHRAHQCLYTSELSRKTGSTWGICEVNLFGGEVLVKQLRDQAHLYSVLEKGDSASNVKISGAIVSALQPQLDGIKTILEKMSEPEISVVTMTITEKGYCADIQSGKLDLNNPLIKHDLATPREPQSAIGYIVEALRIRRARGIPAFTVLSCDNLQNNGHLTQQVVSEYVQAVDSELATWINENVTFPCSMVDRISPAITPDDQKEMANLLGVEDPCGVVCEPFRQWIIEDNFVNGRPQWDQVGAQFVDNVIPFEQMKLRMLNGSHSFLAYLGYLGGYDFISEAMADPDYRQAVSELMLLEQSKTLNMPQGVDLQQYADQLIERFSNTSLQHRTWQIAMDGSQKLPARFCESLLALRADKVSTKWLPLGIAAWMKYVSQTDESGKAIDVRDPMIDEFTRIYAQSLSPQDTVMALLNINTIFGTQLIEDTELVEQIITAYKTLLTLGAKATIKSFL